MIYRSDIFSYHVTWYEKKGANKLNYIYGSSKNFHRIWNIFLYRKLKLQTKRPFQVQLHWHPLVMRKCISRFCLEINCINRKRGRPLKRVWKQSSCKEILGCDHLLRIVRLTHFINIIRNHLVSQSVAFLSIN